MLKPGGSVHVVATSGVIDVERIEAGADVLRGWGFEVDIDPATTARHRYLAGDDTTRLVALRRAAAAAWADGGAVWMARGGYGLSRLLPDLLERPLPPVPFIGFSDGTVLLNHHAGPALHAPVINSLIGHADKESLAHLRAVLAGERPPLSGQSWVPGSASGRLVGGNLCVLASLAGTSGALRAAGCIVALEDTGEAAYKVDRLLTQLIQGGTFEGALGFALGTFDGADAPEGSDWSVRDVLIERLAPLGVPVLGGLPFGHGRANRAFRFGDARIEGERLIWG